MLGHVIFVGGIFVDPRKVEEMLKWEKLVNVTEIHKRLIEGFWTIATPLTWLIRNETK